MDRILFRRSFITFTDQPIMPIFTFKKHSLRTRDDQRTKASELTLKQSLYPLCLVTVLFFLWASHISVIGEDESDLTAAS